MSERPRKRGTADQNEIARRARVECLLRWQKLLAMGLEHVHSLNWAKKQLMTALERFRAEMKRWPASPKLQAGFDAELSRTTCTVAMMIPQETVRPTWPKARNHCKRRNDEGRAATKDYKAAGSSWRRCDQCGSRWKLVSDARGQTAWEEEPPLPYPGAKAPSKAKHCWSRSAPSQGSLDAFQPKPRSPRRFRAQSRPQPEVHSLTAGSDTSSPDAPAQKPQETQRASLNAGLPLSEVSEEDSPMMLAPQGPIAAANASDWETAEVLAQK